MNDMKIGGTSVGGDISDGQVKAVIDSGTSLIIGNFDMVNPILELIGEIEADCSNLDQMPEIEFNFGGRTYTLGPEDYVLKIGFGPITQCTVGIMGA